MPYLIPKSVKILLTKIHFSVPFANLKQRINQQLGIIDVPTLDTLHHEAYIHHSLLYFSTQFQRPYSMYFRRFRGQYH